MNRGMPFGKPVRRLFREDNFYFLGPKLGLDDLEKGPIRRVSDSNYEKGLRETHEMCYEL